MAYLPNRGDIVHLDFDPSSGREMKGPYFGLVLSGKLPRWAFAALARHFAPRCPWVAVDDPAHNRLVVVHSQTPSVPLGAALDRLAPDPLSVSS